MDRVDSYAEQSTVWSFYFQDDWKVTRRLNLKLGLRYELEGPLTERFDRSIRGFDYNAAMPIEAQVQANYARNPTPEVPLSQFLVRGGLTFANVNGVPRTLFERDTNNFMPRFGLAYKLGGKTVIRGGLRMFSVSSGARGDVIQNGFSQRTNLVTHARQRLNFLATLANPFPGGNHGVARSSARPLNQSGAEHLLLQHQAAGAYQQRWQFGIQRELPYRVLRSYLRGQSRQKIETSARPESVAGRVPEHVCRYATRRPSTSSAPICRIRSAGCCPAVDQRHERAAGRCCSRIRTSPA